MLPNTILNGVKNPMADVRVRQAMAMSIDKDGLPLLVLAMALLTAAAVAVVEARRHVPAAVVWVLGAPVLVAGLWAVTQQVDRLLPNLF